jgi:thiol-disulfide isomerase/thioredoxin
MSQMQISLATLLCLVALTPARAPADTAPKSACQKPESCPVVGKPAPPFALPLASGGRVSLRELLERKRPVIVSFWRHDCAPCVAEFPELQKLADEWGEKVSILLVHVGGPEAKMRARLEEWHVTLPAVLDAYECTGARYCADSFPQLWVLDAQGNVRASFKGAQKAFTETLRAAVEPLLVRP